MFYVILFFFAILMLFLRWQFSVGGFTPITIILGFWTLSAFGAIYLYAENLIPGLTGNVTLLPYVFLFSMLYISIYPFRKIKYSKIRIISTEPYEKFLYYLSVFFIICSILPLIEHLIYLFKNIGQSVTFQQQLNDIYEIKREEDVNQLSLPARVLNGIISPFGRFIPFLLLYWLGKNNYSKKFKFLLLLPILNVQCAHFIGASRAALFLDLANYILVICFCRHTLSQSIWKTLKRITIIIFSIISSALCFLSLARFLFGRSLASGAQTMTDWITVYFSESTLRFNAFMWNISTYMQGDNCFSFIKKILGLHTFNDILDRQAYWQPKTKILGHVFYTFIGDFYGDFGPIGCFLIITFFVSICGIIIYNLKQHPYEISFHSMYFLILWASICMYGFTYFLYKTFYNGRTLFIQILLMFILYLIKIFKKKGKI